VYLVQILLPVQDARGERYSKSLYNDLARDLTTRFGGLTAYTQAPATGYWEEGPGRTLKEPVVIYEVMVDDIERTWWAALRERLEIEFSQEELVVRAQEVHKL
jgi:hypothetical protein